MALSDGSTLPSTRLEPGEEDRVVNEEDGIDDVVQGHVPQQQQVRAIPVFGILLFMRQSGLLVLLSYK